MRPGYLFIRLNLVLSRTPNTLKIIDILDPVYAITLYLNSCKIFSKVVAGTFFANPLYITFLQLGFNMYLRQLEQGPFVLLNLPAVESKYSYLIVT